MRRCRKSDTNPISDESATISAFCRKLLQVCQVCSKIPDRQSDRLKSLFTYIHNKTQQKKSQEFFYQQVAAASCWRPGVAGNFPFGIRLAPKWIPILPNRSV